MREHTLRAFCHKLGSAPHRCRLPSFPLSHWDSVCTFSPHFTHHATRTQTDQHMHTHISAHARTHARTALLGAPFERKKVFVGKRRHGKKPSNTNCLIVWSTLVAVTVWGEGGEGGLCLTSFADVSHLMTSFWPL